MNEELDRPEESEVSGIPSWVWPLAVFLVVTSVYALVAGDRVLKPSDHFHFVDLAHSYMDGRLDTDTPKRPRGSEGQEDDAIGFQEAVDRALTDEQGEPTGRVVGNDWSYYYVVHLKEDGREVRGVWPWANIRNPSSLDQRRKHHFLTFGGDLMILDRNKDIARTCGDNGKSFCRERVYHVSFPPFPALVMMPAAKVWGYNTNDVLITVLFGGLNALLVFFLIRMLVRRGYADRSMRETLWLVALFSFGTVAFFSSVRGEVWFTALIIGMTLNLAFLIAALDARHPFLAGLCIALGFATRTPLLFASVFFALQLWWPASGERGNWKALGIKVGLFALPTLAVGIALMVLNNLRFENALEFGHTYLAGGARASIREHGLFSFEFLNRNLSSMLTNMPILSLESPYIRVTRHGLGLFATTPAIFLLLWPKKVDRLWRALAVTVLVIAIPAAFYQNTGWEQFGYRFSLDWTPFLVALFAIDRRRIGRLFIGLILLSIAVNLFGALTFGRGAEFSYFYYN